jgi:PST family polysaccharide transporter
MALGAVWMIFARLADRGLGLISTVILVRLLAPSDFGIVAMAMSIIAILEIMAAFSFEVALIQNQEAGREHFDTAWTLNILIGFGIAIALVLLAWPTSYFYDEPRVAPVMFFLALGAIVRGFENIGVVNFRKNMEFNKEFLYRFSQRFAGFLVTVPLAFVLKSYWALVFGTLVWRTSGLCLSYAIQNYRPRFSLAARESLFNFSKWLFLSNLAAGAMLRLSHFIVGRLSGPRGLGFYTVGYEIANLPTTDLVAPINRAVFPGYAKMSHDVKVLRQGALLAIPAGVGIAATADLIVPVLLGPKWLNVIPIMGILAIHGALQAIQSNLYSVYLALGLPKLLTMISTTYLLVFLIFLITLTSKYDIVGAAWACMISTAIILPVNYGVAFRLLNIRLRQFLAQVWRPIIGVLVMYALVRSYVGYDQVANAAIFRDQLVHLLAAVMIGILSYGLIVLSLWWIAQRPAGAEQYLLDKLRNRLTLRSPRG